MTVSRDGVAINVEVEGRGPYVTLLHGVGSHLQAWDGVVATLRDEFTLIRYDLRGHGNSGKPPGPYHLDDYVADLAAVLDAQSVARTALVGFSFGGMIVQAFAARYPERVDTLAIVSAVAGRTPEQRAAVLKRAAELAAGGPTLTVGAAVERWFTPEFRERHPDVIQRQVQRVLGNDPAGYAAAYRVFAESDVLDELSRITCPTLVMTGEHDTGSTPAMARAMHERIRGSRLVILPRYRHSLLIEATADVVRELRAFLVHGGLEPARPAEAHRVGGDLDRAAAESGGSFSGRGIRPADGESADVRL
jgi:pimeloyl-ACP methyl ester carboxylesterase